MIDVDVDLEDEWEPERAGALHGADEPPELVYPTVLAFVTEQLVPMYRRSLSSQERTWCAEWWRHSEAVSRLEALWRSWEHLRLDAAMGMSVWFRDHLDHHMAVLLDADGPFNAGELHLHPLAAEVVDPAVLVERDGVVARVPVVPLTEVLIKTDGEIRWSRHFTHAGGGSPRHPPLEHQRNLYVAVLAQACNYGSTRMAELTGISADTIDWTTQWYLREETLRPSNTDMAELFVGGEGLRRGARDGLQEPPGSRTRLPRPEVHPAAAPGLPPPRTPHPSPRAVCWLALLLTRVAERGSGQTWRNINRQLGRIVQVNLAGPAGTVTQTTPPNPHHKAIYQALSIQPPARVTAFDPT
jgi:hypothetical protein